ncbi:hypothetical protein [Streptomyces sp. NBC_00233]|uniref:hypothetical protein n=1 Tax=Streptomyces sp. NBC_00233 TaxID=2975686 RepID=UPI00224FF2F0|nr:hypothetical protein [Streptomyces sp. NBC_00233]MCX5233097.1 hypothetical protein [Streptomyces sp. NBC_00233]
MTSRTDTERLREVFADAAYDITPSPVPLAAIEKAGRARRRRRTAGLTVGCGLLLTPLAITAAHIATPVQTHIAAPVQTHTAARPAATIPSGSVRVVAPGERVQAAPGVKLWLTADGKHWSTPGMPEGRFRSAVDGNMGGQGASMQQEPAGENYFMSGIYIGWGDAARVRVVTKDGTITGTVVKLAGKPGWGAWYATSKRSELAHLNPSDKKQPHSFVRSVTVYDTAGHIVAQTTLPAYM